MRDAGALAESLLAEVFAAMKIWPFDIYDTSLRRSEDQLV